MWSDFHYIVCKGIIETLKLRVDDCIFVVDRATNIEDCFHQKEIYGVGRYLLFGERLKYFLHNRIKVKAFFRNSEVTVYLPFSFRYASHSYNDFVFYEEGLSAYRKVDCQPEKHALVFWMRKMLVTMLAPFNKQIQGYLMGFVCQEKHPREKTRLVSLSPDCYQDVLEKLVEKVVIPVPSKPVEKYNIPSKSVVFVLDRLTALGRPFSLDHYRECVKRTVERLKNNGVGRIYLKYHPQDFNNPEAKGWMESILDEYQMEGSLFNGRLEYLALQNISTVFVGTNSTILFYAPILGDTNKSMSFYKELVNKDAEYKKFIEGWNDFDKFFSKNVMCY